MSHIMIDLETMGLRPNAAILSIGAVHFDEDNFLSEFHTPISLASCLEHGLTQDQSTVDWWMKQSAEARSSWQREDAPPLVNALESFSHWVRSTSLNGPIKPWGNGADFDLVLLKSAYGVFGADTPWKFYNHHCFRTMKNVFQVAPVVRQGVHHNALDDAKHQATHLQLICKVHNIRLT